MRALTVWKLGVCVCGGVALAGCEVRATPAPPGPVTAGDSVSLGAACRDPRLKWANRKARSHETIEGARLKLVPEKGNHKTMSQDMEIGRVLALLVVESGPVEFAGGTVTGPDSICIFLKGAYPYGESAGNLRSTFIRRKSGSPLEEVGTYVRVGTPHEEAEVDWIVDYDEPRKGAGMLPFPPASPPQVRKQLQTACPGACCAAKKEF